MDFKDRVDNLTFVFCHLYAVESFTSGVTPVDLLVASIAAEALLPTYFFKLWWELNSCYILQRAEHRHFNRLSYCGLPHLRQNAISTRRYVTV